MVDGVDVGFGGNEVKLVCEESEESDGVTEKASNPENKIAG